MKTTCIRRRTFAFLLSLIVTTIMAASSKQVALVTGGNRGIGLEVCRQLLALQDDDYHVILTSRDQAKGKRAAASLSSNRVTVLVMDVANSDSIAQAAAHVKAQFGVLDVLVNNAGINYDTWHTASTADLDQVQETMDTNLMGPWRCSLGFLELLQKSTSPRIVNVSSGAGSLQDMSTGGTPGYSVSKAALNALTIKLAKDLPKFRINAVCPGWTATDMGGGGRPIPEGAAGVVWAATLDAAGPTGGCFRDGKPIPF